MQRKATKPRIDVRKFFHNNTSTILTCVGAVGVIATSVLAVRATPKAIERIKMIVEKITMVIHMPTQKQKQFVQHGHVIFQQLLWVLRLLFVYLELMY